MLLPYYNLIPLICIAIGGAILRFFPPKKINSFYGYRTPRSMKNQENWDFAQKYAGQLMLSWGLAGSAGFILKQYTRPSTSDMNFYLPFIMFGLLGLGIFFFTERALK